MAARAMRRGAIAASAVQRAVYSYNFNVGSKPAGMAEDSTRSEMRPLTIANGNRLQELSATGGSGAYWYAQYPGSMASLHYMATVTVGNQSSGTSRGAVVWVGGTDGAGGDGITNLWGLRVLGQSGNPMIFTKTGLGAAIVSQATATATAVSPGDTISLEVLPTDIPNPGSYKYIGYKNGSLIISFTDTEAAIFGTPGKAWGGGGYGAYSGGYFPSLGVYAMSCTDL